MRQINISLKSLLVAGFVLLLSVIIVDITLSHAQTPLPLIKPDIEEKKSNNPQTVPLPKEKPAQSAAMIKVAPFEPNSKVVVVSAEGGLKIVDDVAGAKSKVIFSDRQARLTQDIFELQAQGKIQEADKNIALLNNHILMGHILAERYLHPTAYIASEEELKNWLNKYSDHPQAKSIYKLAVSKNADLERQLQRPKIYKKISGNLSAIYQKGKLYHSTKTRSSDQDSRVRQLKKDISEKLKEQHITLAFNILSNDYAVQFMDDVEYDHQQSMIAAGYMYAGSLDNALRLANSALKRSGSNVPMAGWVKGLVEWQQGRYQQAAIGFQSAASSQYASGWLRSASAYWASRSHMRSGNPELVSKWLSLASTYPRTFYGLIAIRALGHQSQFNWQMPRLNREYRKIIEETENGKRASALVQSGQFSLAEAELKNLSFNDDVRKKRALLAYAHHYNLPSLMMALGNSFSGPKGQFYDGALYPVMSFVSDDQYIVDRALIHAFVRQESRFNQRVSNPSGATGLMQLMPSTANHVSGQDIYQTMAGQYLLQDPKLNISLGQQYIQELLNYNTVNQDLVSLAVAYNAGPGNLSKWKAERSHIDDPLLFIETIPYPETRAFVERVLANYWIYKIRFDEPTPSLDAVAEGKWATRVASKD